jgi:hypothetical protein
MKLNEMRIIDFFFIFYLISIAILYVKIGYHGAALDTFNFLYNVKEHYSDSVENLAFVKNNNPYFKSEAWHPSFYPPAAYGLILIFKGIGLTTFGKWASLNIIGVIIFGIIAKRNTSISNEMIVKCCFAFLLCYPFLYGLDRGNLENVCILLISYAFLLRHSRLSAVLIGIAAGLKVTPLILLLWFFKGRRYDCILIGVLMAVIINVLALLYMDGGFVAQIFQFLKNIVAHGNAALVNPVEYYSYQGPKEYVMQGGTLDIFDAIRIVALKLNFYVPGGTPYIIYKVFVILMLVAIFIRIRRIDSVDLLILLTIIFTITVPLTYVPRLAIFVPLLLLIAESGQRRWLFLLIIFLLIPKSFIQIHHKVDINAIIVPVLLLFTFIYILYDSKRAPPPINNR